MRLFNIRFTAVLFAITLSQIGARMSTAAENDPLLGKSLPQVKLESSQGGDVAIPKDLEGKWTLLYFYPKDDTPGCTKQACSYRDNLDRFKKLDVRLYGVSLDDLKSHDSFVRKFHLNFPLLADTQHQLSGDLGVYGKTPWGMGLSRDTFLIDPHGKVRQVWRKVSPESTVDETYATVEKFVKNGGK